MKVVSVIGGRPHLIKCEPIHKALQDDGATHVVIDCGPWSVQTKVYEQFAIPTPMISVRSPESNDIEDRIFNALSEINPAVVLLYGDLEPTLHGARASIRRGLPSIHIEAGYRNHDPQDPEEKVRSQVDRLVTHRIAFSTWMVSNLTKDRIPKQTISVFSNPALHTLYSRLQAYRALITEQDTGLLSGLVLFHHNENLASAHRLEFLLDQLEQLANKFPLTVILYEKLNQKLHEYGLTERPKSISDARLVPSLEYTAYIQTLSSVSFVVTDCTSIGVECSFLCKPCFVLRKHSPLNDLSPIHILMKDLPKDLTSTVADVVTASPKTKSVNLDQLYPRYDGLFLDLLSAVSGRKPWLSPPSS
jgi:UDP-N-acetylglucosamine 2-epimerase (non-hydrolysing)